MTPAPTGPSRRAGVCSRESSAEERLRRGLANPLRASVMYPPDRRLFAPYRILASEQAIRQSLERAVSPIGLYVHVPFCETKCTYCDYETVPLRRHDATSIDAYVAALVAELAAVAEALPSRIEVAGLDIGGGTPGVLGATQVEQILRAVDRLFLPAPAFEVSIETTPTLAAAEPEKWRRIARAGVARASMGIQTSSRELLGRFNRAPHTPDRARAGMDALCAAGFSIVNVDLMFALPGLDADSWEAALELALSLGPGVVTAYDTVYKNRGIASQAALCGDGPSPAAYGAQYDLAFRRLTGAGYTSRYGSVNFSRVPGRLGTSRYLEGRIRDGLDYVGVGLYASSLLGDTWRFGLRDYGQWLAAASAGRLAAQDLYRLPARHVMAKHVSLALSYGVFDAVRFERRFGVPLGEVYRDELALLSRRRLMRPADDGWEVVPGRFGELPGIRAVFYPDDAVPLLELPVLSRVTAASPR